MPSKAAHDTLEFARPDIMPGTLSDKAALRRTLLADRQAIAAEVRIKWNMAIGARLLAWWDAHPMKTLGVYWPIRGEPDLQSAYADLVARGIHLALPVVVDRNAPLRFIAWKPGDVMVKDAFGVSIPMGGAEIRPEALLIPCVGFNEQCFRLGYGGGFFDRTLSIAPRPLAIGIGYACGLARFDADAHDIALDAVLTESSLITAT